MTNWAVLAVAISLELALAKSVHTLLGERERLLEKHQDRRLIARSNLQADHILPRLARLFSQTNSWRAANASTEADALLAVGYENALGELTVAYVDYVRLNTLPRSIMRSALAVVISFLFLIVLVPVLLYDAAASHDRIPEWAFVLAAVLGTVCVTLAVVSAVFYYRFRHGLTALMEKYG